MGPCRRSEDSSFQGRRDLLKQRRFQRVQDGQELERKRAQSLGTYCSREKLEVKEP